MTQTHRGRSRARGGASGRFPLSEAKLAAPSVRPGTMDRPRIRSVLDRDDVALTLVAAPPGYGKTTAVRVWCAGVDAALSWVTLDPVDNDPVSLWSYVATAVDRIREGLGRRALQRLNAGMSSSEDAVEELLNGMAAFGAPIVLVLDDLHTVTSPECLGSLDHAISHLPPNVRLFAISRTDPALDLARLRVSQALVELRAAELAFTPTEAHDLLVARGQLKIAKPQVDELVERTEGWPAALVLAGLWLRTRRDPDAVVRDFRGDHRLLAEYLSREVMASMDHDQRTFMLTAAVLGEVTPDLCDAVLGRTDSAAILSDLEHSNLFVQRLERGAWYRVHPLFAEYARAQLTDAEPDAPARIDTHAARWLRERGLVIEALEHASAAGDHEMVAELVHEHHLALIRSGMGRTLLHWVRTLPDEVVERHPEIAASAALAVIVVGESALASRRYLAIAGEALRRAPAAASALLEVEVTVARTLALDHGVTQALRDGRRAVELARNGLDEATSGALVAYARALYFGGDLDEAASVAAQALDEAPIRERLPSLMHAHTTLAFVDAERGRVELALRHAERARHAVGTIGTRRSWLGANASAALGVARAGEGRLVDAERELARAEHLFRDDVPTIHHTWLLVVLAGVRVRRGHLDDAHTALDEAREELAQLPDSGRLPAMADAVEADLAEASRRARHGELLEPPSEAELSVLRLLATDLSVREIGERLFLSPNTIRTHRRLLYRKLGVHTRTDAVARATALGLLEKADHPG